MNCLWKTVRRVLIGWAFAAGVTFAQGGTLQDIAQRTATRRPITVYPAREVITLDADHPRAEAIAIQGDRILEVGDLATLSRPRPGLQVEVDRRFAHQVIVPGFIAQHDHPLLTALTMTSEIIAIEDWVLPSGTVPAAKNRNDYLKRLRAAASKREDPEQPLITWGFHHYFFGKLTREDLDQISRTRPILVWHRSCHEFILNTAAIEAYGITPAYLAKQSPSAQKQSNWEEGHFWEQGLFGVLPQLAPVVASPERLAAGLAFTVKYFHASGITLACEPGGLLSKPLQEAQNQVLSGPDNPFRFYFIPDGKSLIAAHPEDVIAETERTWDWGMGMTRMLPRRIKLFADGAIYSQLMQLTEPYTDGHQGEWMMDLAVFARAFRTYWDAGYQIHVHVNGDAGLSMVLDQLEQNLKRNPREDHRTVIVHFAVSKVAQVKRIQRLGAIVSANPYYPVALADRYGEVGLGSERADPMVRLGDVERAGISFSCHSDMPMAPAQPLFLMHCALNRQTMSGRVAAPQQRVSREAALRSVTWDAAYSLGMEHEVGSLEAGKLANLTILEGHPLTCEATRVKDIPIWGTVHEGRVLPLGAASLANRRFDASEAAKRQELVAVRQANARYEQAQTSESRERAGCICALQRALFAPLERP